MPRYEHKSDPAHPEREEPVKLVIIPSRCNSDSLYIIGPSVERGPLLERQWRRQARIPLPGSTLSEEQIRSLLQRLPIEEKERLLNLALASQQQFQAQRTFPAPVSLDPMPLYSLLSEQTPPTLFLSNSTPGSNNRFFDITRNRDPLGIQQPIISARNNWSGSGLDLGSEQRLDAELTCTIREIERLQRNLPPLTLSPDQIPQWEAQQKARQAQIAKARTESRLARLNMFEAVVQECLDQHRHPKTLPGKILGGAADFFDFVGIHTGYNEMLDQKISALTKILEDDFPVIRERVSAGESIEDVLWGYPVLKEGIKHFRFTLQDPCSEEAALRELNNLARFFQDANNYDQAGEACLQVLSGEFENQYSKISAQKRADLRAEAKAQTDLWVSQNRDHWLNPDEDALAKGARPMTEEQIEGLREGMLAENLRVLLRKEVAAVFDPSGLRGEKRIAWELYNDIFDPQGEWFNLADATWDRIAEEVAINAPLIAVSGGVASLARAGMTAAARAVAGRLIARTALTEVGEWVAERGVVRLGLRLAGRGAGLLVEGAAFETTFEALHSRNLWSSDYQPIDRWSRIISSSLMLGMFKGAGSLSERAFAREAVGGAVELTRLGRLVERMPHPTLQAITKHLLVRGHAEAAALVLYQSLAEGVLGGGFSREDFWQEVGDSLLSFYIQSGALNLGYASADMVLHRSAKAEFDRLGSEFTVPDLADKARFLIAETESLHRQIKSGKSSDGKPLNKAKRQSLRKEMDNLRQDVERVREEGKKELKRCFDDTLDFNEALKEKMKGAYGNPRAAEVAERIVKNERRLRDLGDKDTPEKKQIKREIAEDEIMLERIKQDIKAARGSLGSRLKKQVFKFFESAKKTFLELRNKGKVLIDIIQGIKHDPKRFLVKSFYSTAKVIAAPFVATVAGIWGLTKLTFGVAGATFKAVKYAFKFFRHPFKEVKSIHQKIRDARVQRYIERKVYKTTRKLLTSGVVKESARDWHVHRAVERILNFTNPLSPKREREDEKQPDETQSKKSGSPASDTNTATGKSPQSRPVGDRTPAESSHPSLDPQIVRKIQPAEGDLYLRIRDEMAARERERAKTPEREADEAILEAVEEVQRDAPHSGAPKWMSSPVLTKTRALILALSTLFPAKALPENYAAHSARPATEITAVEIPGMERIDLTSRPAEQRSTPLENLRPAENRDSRRAEIQPGTAERKPANFKNNRSEKAPDSSKTRTSKKTTGSTDATRMRQERQGKNDTTEKTRANSSREKPGAAFHRQELSYAAVQNAQIQNEIQENVQQQVQVAEAAQEEIRELIEEEQRKKYRSRMLMTTGTSQMVRPEMPEQKAHSLKSKLHGSHFSPERSRVAYHSGRRVWIKSSQTLKSEDHRIKKSVLGKPNLFSSQDQKASLYEDIAGFEHYIDLIAVSSTEWVMDKEFIDSAFEMQIC